MQTPRPKLATLVVVDGKVAEVEAFAFGSGQELLRGLILDIHHVDHGSGKTHARRAPRAVEQALAQLVYIDFDFHGETSRQAKPLLTSAKHIHSSNKSCHLFIVHLRGQAPHGLIVGELYLIDKAIPSTLVRTDGGLAILAELFESIPKRIYMAAPQTSANC